MNSFYIWSQQEPPARYRAPNALLDVTHQRRVIDAIRPIEGLCLLENDSLTQWWEDAGAAAPRGPLVSYLHDEFAPIAKFGDYQLLKRERSGSPP